MQKLINIIKEKHYILVELEDILKKEYNILSNFIKNENLEMLNSFANRKTVLFKKFLLLKKDRLLLEKDYNIFSPYQDNKELEKIWQKIYKKCCFLKKLNIKNKILTNNNLYLNQNFLDLFKSYQKKSTYDIDGNINS